MQISFNTEINNTTKNKCEFNYTNVILVVNRMYIRRSIIHASNNVNNWPAKTGVAVSILPFKSTNPELRCKLGRGMFSLNVYPSHPPR